MADFDFFDLTGLPFDPFEKKADNVLAKINETIKSYETMFNNLTDQTKREELEEKRNFLVAAKVNLVDKDKKLTDKYRELAKAKTNQVKKVLAKHLELRKRTGRNKVTKRAIRDYGTTYKLSFKNVEDVIQKCGVEIDKTDPLEAYPKFPANMNRAEIELEALRNYSDPNPNAVDKRNVFDFYAFAAYLKGEPQNASTYRSMLTSDLQEIMDHFSMEYSQEQDRLKKICGTLAAFAKTNIFDSADKRELYENYLKINNETLKDLAATLSGENKDLLLDPGYANVCLDTISNFFPDFNVALAIYNKMAKLEADPYIPAETKFQVRCSACQIITQFASEDEAKKNNECSNCRQPLYKPCPSCKKLILIEKDRCSCGYSSEGARLALLHLAMAEAALDENDFDGARTSLTAAESADPTRKPEVKKLRNELNQKWKDYEKPLNDLNALIRAKKFQEASSTALTIQTTHPKLTFPKIEKIIETALKNAQDRFNRAPTSTKTAVCMEILQDCVDYQPAINFLRSHPPAAPSDFVLSPDPSMWCINISWTPSTEPGVSYKLVRKEGSQIPTSDIDGTVLVDNSQNTRYKDEYKDLPGKTYSYAVFASRFGVISEPAGRSAKLLAEVQGLKAEQSGNSVNLSWTRPKNCTNVTIQRTQSGNTRTLSATAVNSYSDNAIQLGTSYSYRIKANYADDDASVGLIVPLTPTAQIDSFKISVEEGVKNRHIVTWDIIQAGIELRIYLNDKNVGTAKSENKSFSIILPEDRIHTLHAEAFSGGNWLRSKNIETVNTYSPCKIDRANSKIFEKVIYGPTPQSQIDLRLKVMEPIPQEVIGFYYAIRTDPNNKWATKAEAEQRINGIKRITRLVYKQSNEIVCDLVGHDESGYYITLFPIFQINGREVISHRETRQIVRPYLGVLEWEVSKPPFGPYKFSIEISDSNRPLDRLPEFVLCKSALNQLLTHYTDPGAIKLLTIKEKYFDTPIKSYKDSVDFESPELRKGMPVFLFEVTQNQKLEAGLKVKWKPRFEGKVR